VDSLALLSGSWSLVFTGWKIYMILLATIVLTY
jgi:hypothetical protein